MSNPCQKSSSEFANPVNNFANPVSQFPDPVCQFTNPVAMLQNDYDLLHQAYEAHRTQHNLFKSRELDARITIRIQKSRISELLLESFALRFKNKKAYQQLQDCKTDGTITTHLLNLTTN